MQKIDSELIAAISAAIASMTRNESQKLVVRSIRRVGQISPVWNSVGRSERLSGKLN